MHNGMKRQVSAIHKREYQIVKVLATLYIIVEMSGFFHINIICLFLHEVMQPSGKMVKLLALVGSFTADLNTLNSNPIRILFFRYILLYCQKLYLK